MKTKDVRKNIETAADFRDLQKLVEKAMEKNAFKERKNPYGVKYTSFEIAQRRTLTKQINRHRKAALKKISATIIPGNKIISTEYQELQPKKARSIKSFKKQRDYDEYMKSARKQADVDYIHDRFGNYKQQYINNFNKYVSGALDLEEVNRFYEVVGMFSNDEFYTFSKIHPELDISFIYPTPGMDEHSKFTMIMRAMNVSLVDLQRAEPEIFDIPIEDIYEPPDY